MSSEAPSTIDLSAISFIKTAPPGYVYAVSGDVAPNNRGMLRRPVQFPIFCVKLVVLKGSEGVICEGAFGITMVTAPKESGLFLPIPAREALGDIQFLSGAKLAIQPHESSMALTVVDAKAHVAALMEHGPVASIYSAISNAILEAVSMRAENLPVGSSAGQGAGPSVA